MKKQLSSQAMTAQQIRTKLKETFPDTKFSVTSESFSMGNSVDISWTNGPCTAQVEEISKPHQYGHFNGMEDIYEYSNSRQDLAQAKYVMTQRNISPEMKLQVSQVLHGHYTNLEAQKYPETIEDLQQNMNVFNNYYNWHQLVYRVVQEMDLTKATGVKEDPDFEGGSMFSGFLPLTGDAQ